MSTTNPLGTGTEWEDLQIKYGNLPQKKKVITEQEIQTASINIAESINPVETMTLKEINRKLDEDDSLKGDEEEDELNYYRKKRIEELKKKKEAEKFGSLYRIGKTDFIEEVTNSSKNNNWVLCHLYSDCVPICLELNETFQKLAIKQKSVKWCIGKASDIVDKYPESNLPCVTVYHNGSCVDQIIGPYSFGKSPISQDFIEFLFWKKFKLYDFDLNDFSIKKKSTKKSTKSTFRINLDQQNSDHTDDDDDDNDDDDNDRHSTSRENDDRGFSSLILDKLTSTLR